MDCNRKEDMYEERFTEPHKQGLERLTGSNRGLFYCNERTEKVTEPETGEERTEWVYDVYEVADARNPRSVKNDVITGEHPFGDETKILRKTLAKVLKENGLYDGGEFKEFKAYNEFCEGV